jgi:trimethylamine--corrinoid protein Co-methyltransferase
MTVIEPEHARAAVEMASIAAGGEQALQERPILSAFQCSLSPLTFDGGPVEAAIVYAEAGIPCGWVAMPLTGATAPMTVAGTLVLQNAELLAGMAMIELLVPGAPTFYGVCTSTMDLNSGSLSLGWGPEEQLFSFASGQLARRYGVPSQLGTFGTGAKTHDWQMGIQHALSGFTSYLSGGDMYCASGTIYGGRVFTFQNPLLDGEMLSIIRRMAEGFRTDAADLAVDVIDSVGPGGHFLGDAHTLAHMRELWMTRFFNRDSWEDWEAAGRPESKHAATERARRILEEHRPEPLPDGAEQRILEVIRRYELDHAG